MSIKLMSAVWDLDDPELHGSRLLLLLALADYANDQDLCWPSIPSLAHRARISNRQAQRVITWLDGRGHIEVMNRGNGKGNSSLYHITLNRDAKGDTAMSPFDGSPPAASDEPKGDIHDIKGDIMSPFGGSKGDMGDAKGDILSSFADGQRVTSGAPKGDICDTKGDTGDAKGDIAMSPDPPIEPPIDPSMEPSGDHRPAADAPPDPESREQLARALCWVCYGHQEIEALSERDASALRAETRRIADNGFDQDDLRAWFRDHWQADWRWQNGRGRPEPAEVRSWIPAVRDDSDIDQETRQAEWRELGLLHNGEGSRDPPPAPPQETGPQVHGELWQNIVDELAGQLVPDTLAWFDGSRLEDLGPVGGDAGGSRVYRILLAKPDGLSWIKDRGAPLLRRTISRTVGEQVLIEVELAEAQPAETEAA